MEFPVYQKEITITEEFLDNNRHVNNVQYVHWVEMMAEEHWNLLKSKSKYKDFVWFLVDHHIRYKKQAYLGDRILTKTYPEEPEGIRQPRKVEFFINNELIVDSRTKWVMMDPENQRVQRLDPDWLNELI
ncbi:MAG: acyl-ACP thioesterase domain-containing protein [Moheibacter sp.]